MTMDRKPQLIQHKKEQIMHRNRFASIIIALFVATGCNEATIAKIVVPTTPTVAQAAKRVLRPVLIVGSDFQSTTISVFDAESLTMIAENVLNSGTVTPLLSTALSGDVVLAQRPTTTSDWVLIDRTNGTLDIVDDSYSVVNQISVGSNPHDYLELSATQGFVARFGFSLANDGKSVADGDDLLEVNPQSGALGTKIAMTPFTAPAANSTVTSAPIYGRADLLLPVQNRVYAVLQNLSSNFFGGEAIVVVIDPVAKAKTARLQIYGVKNCADGFSTQ